MHDVDPKVSTASKFFTNTCLSASFFAVIANEMVMQASKPSGTLATKIPIPKIMHWRAEYLTTKRAKKKNTTPKEIAITVIIKTNLSNSIRRGDFCWPPEAAKSAICPITVFSAIPITIPLPRPFLQRVPKKATFLVSKGSSGWVHSGDLRRGSTSPVRAELSTFISIELITRISAGTFYPLITSTTSPLTNFSAGILVIFPSLKHLHSEGNMFLKPYIKASDFAPCAKVIAPVSRTTIINTKARYKLGKLPVGCTM